MRNDPVLRVFDNGKPYAERLRFKVKGGLHYIRGNSAPYFSLTADGRDRGSEFGGCCHELILEHFPDLADLAALHLSDINGVPMHAEANGWYILAGVFGGAGERYHVGNSERHFPVTPPAGKPWQTTEYRKPTQDECLQIFADHCRVPLDEALAIRRRVAPKFNYPDMRAKWREIMEGMRPRWAQEAQACIAHHGLVVYGDTWAPTANV